MKKDKEQTLGLHIMVYEFPSLPLMVIFFGFCRDARTSTYYKRYKKCKKKNNKKYERAKVKVKAKAKEKSKQTKTKKRPSKMLITEML